ncbi:hypothetical protein CYV19_06220 [Natronobacterium gregoryi SP2]|uniref:Uncharacterized protein n=2 Tax=Natronobacterium gregoryi TaxID=44930 RepID=L9YH23_NATGS|nr:hypothetical protein C490_02316 [Natronobacterium gregoryi SP2]PLK21026.1 hypothetical protein CYV19_06220 [Natronobacterium gregoryi SP2]
MADSNPDERPRPRVAAIETDANIESSTPCSNAPMSDETPTDEQPSEATDSEVADAIASVEEDDEDDC